MSSVPENPSPDGSNTPETARGGRPRLPRSERRVMRVGVNVNQWARVANQTGRLPEVKHLQAILNMVLEIRSEM